CRDWLNKNLPHAERIAVNSNGEASRLAAKDPESLAIGPKQAAKIYDLAVLNAGIEDNANNTTRFLVIGKQMVDPCGKDKTALMVSTPNRPGSLFHILKPLAEHGVDMTRIESRPGRNTNWDYMFFLDILGHEQDESVQKAIELLREDVDLVRVLGSYPVAID
ncbi:MAG: prephenate dehydratase, partial [Thiotrichales bacterium]